MPLRDRKTFEKLWNPRRGKEGATSRQTQGKIVVASRQKLATNNKRVDAASQLNGESAGEASLWPVDLPTEDRQAVPAPPGREDPAPPTQKHSALKTLPYKYGNHPISRRDGTSGNRPTIGPTYD